MSGKVRKPGLLIYRDKAAPREWRWRIRAENGNILADSGEGYANRADAVKGAHSSFMWLLQAVSGGL